MKHSTSILVQTYKTCLLNFAANLLLFCLKNAENDYYHQRLGCAEIYNRLSCFQLAFVNQAICQPNRFGPFEHRTCLPGIWISTLNWLRFLVFNLKDSFKINAHLFRFEYSSFFFFFLMLVFLRRTSFLDTF